jgi:hypothetical protein
VFRVPMPINVFDAPLSKQSVNFTLCIKSFQLRRFVGQVRVIAVNPQNFASREFLINDLPKREKGLGEFLFACINYILEYDNSEKTIAPLYIS